jgi:hypothetical protein
MKNILFFAVINFCFISCDKRSQEPICLSHELTIINLEKQIDELFQENGRLKEQFENCEGFLREKDTLNYK